MGIPVWKRGGTPKNYHLGTPRMEILLHPIRGPTYAFHRIMQPNLLLLAILPGLSHHLKRQPSVAPDMAF